MRFHDGDKKNMSSNELTVVAAHEILVEEAPLVSTIPEIPGDIVESHEGYYVCVYVILQFKTEDTFDNRERHWRNVFEENEWGVDEKALLHAKRWGLYLNEKGKLVKGKYLVEVVGNDKKKLLWEVVGDNVVEEPCDHEDIGL